MESQTHVTAGGRLVSQSVHGKILKLISHTVRKGDERVGAGAARGAVIGPVGGRSRGAG